MYRLRRSSSGLPATVAWSFWAARDAASRRSLRAGVIPALRLKMIPGRGDFWRVAICSPGRAPVANLVDALDGLLAPEPSGERRKQIRDVLYGRQGLGGFLPAFKHEIPLRPDLSKAVLDKANLLVLIDQFEELFREENRGKAETAALAGFIIDAWRGRDHYPGLYLILTMRTDDLHRCAEFIDLPDVINASGYLTRRLKETELRQAIVEPVRPAMFRAGLLAEARPSGVVDVRPYDVQVVTELLRCCRGNRSRPGSPALVTASLGRALAHGICALASGSCGPVRGGGAAGHTARPGTDTGVRELGRRCQGTVGCIRRRRWRLAVTTRP